MFLSGFDVNGSFTCDVRANGDCRTYTNDDKCHSCNQGKYLTQSNTCVNNEAENCAVKSTTKNECESCKTDFWKDSDDGNKCKENTATNCADNSKSQSANECTACKAEHYKDANDNNKCKPHTAQNCKTFHQTSDECLECKADHLEGSDQGKKTCSAYTTPDCHKFSTVKDECTECVNNTHYLENNGSKNVCTARKVTNCNKFTSDADTCSECKQKTYLNNGKCEDNTTVEKCKTYSISQDKCTECEDGYYKSASKNECWLYPDGIDGCIMYTSRTTCTACDDKTYLSGGKCLNVTTQVTDCQAYKSATECEKCKSGKLLVGAECKTITASSCLEYTDEATCKSCVDPFVFNTETKKCESVGITDCTKGKYNSTGNTCDMCQSGKVLSSDNKKCESPTTPVANCMNYSSLTKCEKCNANHILSLDGLKCTDIGSLAGANCSIASTVSEHVCDVCRWGYVKDAEGKCIKTELDFCLIASSDLKTCKLCSPSSYMDKDGKCIAPTEDNKSAKLFGALMAVLFSLLAW